MATYSLRFPANFDVPAHVLVAGILVVAATTKGGYPLWSLGGMFFLYVLCLAVRCTNVSRTPLSRLVDRR